MMFLIVNFFVYLYCLVLDCTVQPAWQINFITCRLRDVLHRLIGRRCFSLCMHKIR